MSLNKKKIIFTIVSALILTIQFGCSKGNNNQTQTSPVATYTEQQDQELTKKLTSEKVVQSGKVYLTGDQAIASITVKKGTDEKTYKELATKYANTLKQKYNNKKINAYTLIESKIVAHISL
jgi:hypothetical protein